MVVFHGTINEESRVGEARRAVKRAAEARGFSPELTERAALVATELGTNLVKHTDGKGGELVVQESLLENKIYLDFWSLDRGPGIANLGQALRDGFSTAGTYGAGLGGLQRQAVEFDLHSEEGQGLAVFARVGEARPDGPWELGALAVPIQGETVCGDGWALRADGTALHALLADGLGHGPFANDAAEAAKEIFRRGAPGESPVEALAAIHRGLGKTRGAAVALARWTAGADRVDYAGIGNIVGVVVSPGRSQQMVSMNGITGHEARRVQGFSYEAPAGSLLVLHSDGLHSRWNLASYRGLLRKHPALVAGVLYRDASRGRDDCGVVVARRRA